MNSTMTEGPSASAASVVGEREPRASPRAELVNDSRVTRPRNLENLGRGAKKVGFSRGTCRSVAAQN
jgi:hypothetical protein